MKKKSKVDKKNFLEPTQSKQKSFYSRVRIEEIILSYNILIEFYVMINKLSCILHLHVSKS